jgi:hypothetical protein
VALLALIAGTSPTSTCLLVEFHGQPGWVVALTPLSVDGVIVAASTRQAMRNSVCALSDYKLCLFFTIINAL